MLTVYGMSNGQVKIQQFEPVLIDVIESCKSTKMPLGFFKERPKPRESVAIRKLRLGKRGHEDDRRLEHMQVDMGR